MVISPEPVIMDRIFGELLYHLIIFGISYVIGDSVMRLIKKYV